MTSFGPTLLAKVLGLNDTQESSLGLVFHYADGAGLPLLDLADLRAVVRFLTSDEGKADLKGLGGLSSSTAGVILRELIAFEDQGADAFFGEPEFDTRDLLRVTADGRGVISLVELPHLQDRPAVFSTFLMWLLADLFHDLPEVGDPDKPELVFFFDEAHLLFADASKDFLEAITRTVRLIRSKGVGVFFVTQSPTDVPDEVLAQLGSRVQHQLRAATPNDAKALKATVNTYPTSSYDDLGKVILSLGIGEAVVTVMNERGAPTPVAWTRLRAPESLMGPADAAAMTSAVQASPLTPRYGVAVDRDSARELLAARLEAGAAQARQEQAPREDRIDYPRGRHAAHEAEGPVEGEARQRRPGAGHHAVTGCPGPGAHGGPGDRPRCLRGGTPAPLAAGRATAQTHQRTASAAKSAGAWTPSRSGRSRSSAVRSRVRAAGPSLLGAARAGADLLEVGHLGRPQPAAGGLDGAGLAEHGGHGCPPGALSIGRDPACPSDDSSRLRHVSSG